MERETVYKNLKVGGQDVVAQGAAGEDRISSLPDEILLSVFSSLPVEQCASLSAVSPQWRRLMDCVFFRYEFTSGDCGNIEQPWRFPGASVRWFHLVNFFGHDHPLRHALDAAEGLVMETAICRSDIPDFVFQIKTLRALSIKDYRLGHPRIKLGCTFLRTLKLERSWIDACATSSILANCRLLETLHLVNCTVRGILFVVQSKSLKNLRVRPENNCCHLRIHAPNIEVLILDLHQCIQYSRLDIRAASKLKEMLLSVATLPCYPAGLLGFRGGLLRFLLAPKELTSLSLRNDAAERLAEEFSGLNRIYLFEKMELLHISLSIREESEAKLLVAMLEKCPRLSQLSLQLLPKRSIEGEPTRVASKLWESLEKLECFDRLQGIKLDSPIISHDEEKLLRIILAKATMLRRAELILPVCWVNEMKEFLYSRKAPQKEQSCIIAGGYRGAIKVEF